MLSQKEYRYVAIRADTNTIHTSNVSITPRKNTLESTRCAAATRTSRPPYRSASAEHSNNTAMVLYLSSSQVLLHDGHHMVIKLDHFTKQIEADLHGAGGVQSTRQNL